jgi:hypothetical protein
MSRLDIALRTAQQQALVDSWNAEHPKVGTRVIRYALINPKREPSPTRTRSEAWLMGGHTAVVMVEGVAGAVACESLEDAA